MRRVLKGGSEALYDDEAYPVEVKYYLYQKTFHVSLQEARNEPHGWVDTMLEIHGIRQELIEEESNKKR